MSETAAESGAERQMNPDDEVAVSAVAAAVLAEQRRSALQARNDYIAFMRARLDLDQAAQDTMPTGA